MTDGSGRRGESTRGRKQDRARTDAILVAAGELLVQHGFDKIRIQDVADRAGSGLGTIYRRWETKEALLADAIRAFPEPEPDLTEDALEDLATYVHGKALLHWTNPDLMPGLIAAFRANDEIAAAVRERYDHKPLRALLERVLGPGHRHVDLLGELIPAVLLQRVVFRHRPLDADEIVRDVVALVRSLTPNGETR